MDFNALVDLLEELQKTSKRSEKTYLVSQFLKNTQATDLSSVLLLLQGSVFSQAESKNLGVSVNYVIKALSRASGFSKDDIIKLWKQEGDLGLVAQQLIGKKTQVTLHSQTLTLQKVISNLKKLAQIEGTGSVDQKVQLVTDLLTSATATEAKYVTRFVLEVMRIGIGEGILRDAIVWAYLPAVSHIFEFDATTKTFVPTTIGYEKKKDHEYEPITAKTFGAKVYSDNIDFTAAALVVDEKEARRVYNELIEIVQTALDFTNDILVVADLVRQKKIDQLKELKPQFGKPIKVMLSKKAIDAADGINIVSLPCMLEYKYDGFRIQAHKQNNSVVLFTRRLERVTEQFPEVVAAIKNCVDAKTCILDCEAVGYDAKTQKYTPFQHISQRIRRKHNIESLQKELPVELNVFDIILLESNSLIAEPFEKRRKLLEKIVKPKPKMIKLSEAQFCEKESQVDIFYQQSLKAGNEGIMLKTLQAPYKPGSRVGYLVKLKPTMDTLDLVITQAHWGEGKRSQWMTSFTISCINENGQALAVGKVGTGFKELEQEGITFDQMTKLLEPLILSEKGKTVTVKPQIVLEIAFEEIQKSKNYESGFALRFPRVVALRKERNIQTASTQELVEEFLLSTMKETVIVFCAHPDDEAIGPGGTIAKYAKEGKKVIVVIFSQGESSHPWQKKHIINKTRREEAKRCSKILGVHKLVHLNFKDGDLRSEIKKPIVDLTLRELLVKHKPLKVFTHAADDVHNDHRSVHKAVLLATDAYNKSLPQTKRVEVFTFNIWSITFRKRNDPQLHVDITQTFDIKQKAMAVFKSQKVSLIQLWPTVIFKALFQGSKSNTMYAESFYKIR